MRDLSICVNTKDNDCNQIEDFERHFKGTFNKKLELEGTEDEYVVFEGVIDDTVFERVMTFVKMSPYGGDYEILDWRGGNSRQIW